MNKIIHQRKRNRLPKFDYSQSGWYFVTICVYRHECVLGEIVNNEMVLNRYGTVVNKHWLEIPNHYQNILLDEYVIMPNHIHGIIIIWNQYKNNKYNQMIVGNRHACSLQVKYDIKRQYQLLPIIIGSFKSASSKLIHDSGLQSFRWQKSFYDHIIRNEQSLWKIRQYIKNNPLKWNEDKNNLENFYM